MVWRKDCASSESKFVCPSKTELRALVAQRAVIFLGRKQRRLSWWSILGWAVHQERQSAKRSSDFCGCHNNWKKILPPPQGASRRDECWILSPAAAYRPTYCKTAFRRALRHLLASPIKFLSFSLDAKKGVRKSISPNSARDTRRALPLTNYAIRSDSRATFIPCVLLEDWGQLPQYLGGGCKVSPIQLVGWLANNRRSARLLISKTFQTPVED